MKLRGRRERNLTVNLKRDQFSEAYLSRLEAGLQLLFQWFASLKPCPNVKWNRVNVNELLCKFVQDMFDVSTPYYLVVHAILAFEKSYPQFHKKLRPTWNSVRTWKLRLDISLRVPIPPQILHAVVLFCITSGLVWDRPSAHIWIPFGIQLWMGFEGLLRPGEMQKVCRKDVSLPSHSAFTFSQCAMILITNPKNRATFGRMQTAIVRQPNLIKWLEWMCVGLPKAARLNPTPLPRLRVLFQSVLEKLHLKKFGLTLASLRAGRATQLYMEGMPLDRIRFEGRWKNMATLEHYIQEAAATTILTSLDVKCEDLLTALIGNLHMLEGPPVQPWCCLFSRDSQFRRLRNLRKP